MSAIALGQVPRRVRTLSPTTRALFASYGMGHHPAQLQLRDESVGVLFDFFEDAMLAVTSSFLPVEAFCNVTLVERAMGGNG